MSIRGFFLWSIFVATALPVLAWVTFQILAHAFSLDLRFDLFYLKLLFRTLGFSALAGMIALLLALPAAVVLGRGRGIIARATWFLVPLNLLMPSLAYAYGWSQFLRLLNLHPELAGFWDVMRCIFSIATWLWGLPAIVIGLSLRRVDAHVQQQALLDGALCRVTLRLLAPSMIASFFCVWVLAMQEFAVYEPTGISVIATEVRMVYETGAFSDSENPIIAPIETQGLQSLGFVDSQQARSAGAVLTAAPVLILVALVGIILWRASRRVSASEILDVGPWVRALDARWLCKIGALCVLFICLGIPTISMILSLKRAFDLSSVWNTFSPSILGSLTIAFITGALAFAIALRAATVRERFLLPLSMLTFLLGGQMVAIALMRLYNQTWLDWIYNAAPIVVIAHLALFGWIALCAGRASWSPAWRELRELAALDGGSPGKVARGVILPLAWPLCAAAGVLVMILCLTEVPATLLLRPLRPPMLIPMLMTWVHMLRYDDMIEGTLLMMGVVVALAGAGGLLLIAAYGKRKMEKGKWNAMRRGLSIYLFPFTIFHSIGCSDASSPDDIWCETGVGPAQVVYPRGITYSKIDDTFFIVDRMARVQRLDASGKCLNQWRMPEWKMGKPVGLSVGPDGNLYVPDTHYQRVMVYSPKGELLRQWGRPGRGNGEFIYPTDVAFDSQGNVYVSEYGDNDRIQVFDASGNYLRQFGSFGDAPGQFARPQSILIDDDILYVADACNHRISVHRLDGTFVRSFGSPGSELGQFRYPYGLDMDSDGNLVVCEFGNNRVQLIDKQSGRGIKTWGTGGRAPGQLAYPWGVAVDRHDRIVAVDAGNNRLQIFEF